MRRGMGLKLRLAVLSIGLLSVLSSIGLSADTVIRWHRDYGSAMEQARAAGKMMLVYFYDPPHEVQWDALLASDASLSEKLGKYVLTKLPLSETVKVDGKAVRLIDHPAFAEMRRQPGLAMIDLTDPKSAHYSYVVTVFPISNLRALDRQRLHILLTLPPGSLTQRTLIYAVRTHLERPQSANGRFHPTLASETNRHSAYQASIANLGHQFFDSRASRIQSQVSGSGMVQEVCAQSYPGQSLVDAAVDCVNGWRQSAGHWSAVRSPQTYYGYDMKRGMDGIWYATGIFVR